MPDAEALFEMGRRLLETDQVAEAVSCLRRAAEQSPLDTAILESLAAAYHRNGEMLPALEGYDRLIELGAATARTWCATGNALTDVGEYAQAIGAYRKSIELDHANPEAHHNLARALYRLGEVDAAVAHLEVAASQCDSIDPWLSLATILPGAPRATAAQILEVRREFAARLQRWAGVSGSRPAGHLPRRRGHGPLRVGYLSDYLDSANYMKPVWALVNHHDRAAFEIHLFSDSPGERGMPGYAGHPRDHVHQTGPLANDDLAALIEAAGIDVLVDLNAYSTADRLALFLRRPAPVTMAWFNMYATSGLPGLDYIVGDGSVVRPGEEPLFSERVLRLPMSYLTFEVTHPVPPVVAPPCLAEGRLTFGSLVSQYKITPPVLDAWAEILRRAAGSRLVLANAALKSVHNRDYVLRQFTERGVDAERIVLCGPANHLDFLRYYDRIDVALDAFPYNGGTTTMEAIWQGVPTLTFDGDRWASRTSLSLLRDTHLGRFVAADAAGLVDLAVDLADDRQTPARLAALRRQMRSTLESSAVCDGRALAGQMERLYVAAMERAGD